MGKGLSRRTFLKGTLGTAGSAAAMAMAAPAAKAVEAVSPPPGEPLVTVIDISRCIGCEECVYACREASPEKYPEPEKPFPGMIPARVPVADWSGRRDETGRLTPYNWLFIQHATASKDGRELALTIPRRCMHCSNPPCVKLCPWGAAKQETNGLSRIDPDICLGGAKCKAVCPWDIPQRQTGVGLYLDILPSMAGNGVMYKCDRCHRKLAKGEQPACIEACPENVQTMGPMGEMIALARQRAGEIGGSLYGLEENGGTNTIYISPVPFEELVIDTGKGRPHLNPVASKMAQGSNLALAILMAPLAGAAAALGKFYRRVREEG